MSSTTFNSLASQLTQPEGSGGLLVHGCLVSGTRFRRPGRLSGLRRTVMSNFSVECFDLVLSDGMMLAAPYVLMPTCM